RLLFDEDIALLSAFLVALHPGLIYFSTEFHPLTFNALFFSIVMLFLLRLSKTHRIKDALLSGVFIGIAFFDRAIALIFIPLFFTLMPKIKAPLKTKLKLFILTLTIASLAVAVWGVRNYSLFHKLILSRSSTGYLFWLGNNPNSTGSAMFDKNQSMLDTLGKDTLSQLKTMDELSQNEYFKETALLFVKQRPLSFLSRYFKKFYYFWWFSPQVGSLYHFNFLFIYKLFYFIIIFSAVSGLYIIAKKRSQIQNVYVSGVAFAVMCCLALAAVQSLFYIEGRHRWVIEPIIMIFSSFTFLSILRTIRYGIYDARKM
ncbi:MAG: glycosyltransferase family 39 protein, partial [Candidatus Omnitrophota bacterium]